MRIANLVRRRPVQDDDDIIDLTARMSELGFGDPVIVEETPVTQAEPIALGPSVNARL